MTEEKAESGVERRAVMDNTTVRALLLMHGGGAVSLLAFLGTIVTEPGLEALVRSILWALLLFHGGLLMTVLHNHLRRRCSLAYDTGQVTSDRGVCFWSWTCLFLSIALFAVAGLVVVVGGFRVY